MVDATDQQVRQVVLAEHLCHREFDAIDGRSGTRMCFCAAPTEFKGMETENAAECHGVSHAALWTVRSDDVDIAEIRHGLSQCLDSLGGDAVIIGDRDARLSRGGSVLHARAGVRTNASSNQAQYFRTEETEARSSGLWAPRMVGPKLTMSRPG